MGWRVVDRMVGGPEFWNFAKIVPLKDCLGHDHLVGVAVEILVAWRSSSSVCSSPWTATSTTWNWGRGRALSRHFIDHARGLTAVVYGRRMYEIMRYWDEDSADWGAEEHDFAAAWRSQRKWVVSRSLKLVGPNATLVEDGVEAVIRGLKAQLAGELKFPDQTWREA